MNVFGPRKLTVQEQAKLDKVEAELDDLEAELMSWSEKAGEAEIGSLEETKALHREAHFISERDKALVQLEKLKIEFGQVDMRKNEKVMRISRRLG